MKFSEEKKRSILLYLLEQIEYGEPDLSKTVSEKCGVSRNTVSQYLLELQDLGAIRKRKRNHYELITERHIRSYRRSEKQLISETKLFDEAVKPYLEQVSGEAKRIWEYAVSEMINNVIDHSEAEELSVEVEQSRLSTRVTLTDNGVGIFEKIQKHFSYDSPEEARRELFKGKLTTDAKNHSGEGIFFTSKMMDEFRILSGGLIFTSDKYDTQSNTDSKAESPKGTVVRMKLSNFTQRRIVEVFDRYSTVNGGFTVTTIPLRHMFDSAPVSRSQAKRVCNRLDQFEEVILDFSGIEWMGQAFAHQVFIVYQKEHPQTLLKPVHMEAEVEKMLRHVNHTP